MADVFLHVGLPKTGTTTIQGALVERAGALTAHGVLVPGGRHAQQMAAYDLLGQRIPGDDAVVAGALDRLLAEINAYAGPRVVVSEEELGLARPRHVHRLVRGLSGHRVFVVIGVRDLGRTLVSAWQQSVVMGATTTWSEFVAGIRQPGTGPTRAAAGFALRHDVLRVLDAWAAHVPADRIRLVTVPPRGAPSDVLPTRFAQAADLPASVWVDVPPVRNASLGAAEVEMIRRLNEQLTGRLLLRQLRHVIGGRDPATARASRGRVRCRSRRRTPRGCASGPSRSSPSCSGAAMRCTATSTTCSRGTWSPPAAGSTTCPRPSCWRSPRPPSPRSPWRTGTSGVATAGWRPGSRRSRPVWGIGSRARRGPRCSGCRRRR